MIGQFERHCPKCGAGICRYNSGAFCWPCSAPEGFAWHWSEVSAEWVLIPVVEVEPPWKPQPGDIVLGQSYQPAAHRPKTDNWDKWRRVQEVGRV